jgi:TP901 family phage tail tape measure protein
LGLEKAAANVAAVMGKTGAAFTIYKQQVMTVSKALSGEFLFSAQQISLAFYTLASAGYDVTKMGEKELIPFIQYAQATQSDLVTATESVITALKAFGLAISDAGHVVDVFTNVSIKTLETMEKIKQGMAYAAPIAGELGMGLEETAAAMSKLVDTGVEATMAGQRLSTILATLLKPTKADRDAFAKLGLTLDDMDPTTHSLVDILLELKAAGADATNMAEMFRSRTAGAAAVLVSSADAIALYTEQLKACDGITAQVAASQKNSLYGALQIVNQSLQNMASTIGAQLAPTLIQMTGYLKGLADLTMKIFGPVLNVVSKNFKVFEFILSSVIILLTLYITKMKIIPAIIALVKGAQIAWFVVENELKLATIAFNSVMETTGSVITALAAAIKVAIGPLGWFLIAISEIGRAHV